MRPRDRETQTVALTRGHARVAPAGELVHEAVRRGVVGLTDVAGPGRDRREQQEHIQRQRGGGAVQMLAAGHFRTQHIGELRRAFLQNEIVAQQSGAVDHAMQRAVIGEDAGDQRIGLRGIADIGLAIFDPARRSESVERCASLDAWRGTAAEHNLRVRGGRQNIFGDQQT